MILYRLARIEEDEGGFFNVLITGPKGIVQKYRQWGPKLSHATTKAEAVVERQNNPKGSYTLTVKP